MSSSPGSPTGNTGSSPFVSCSPSVSPRAPSGTASHPGASTVATRASSRWAIVVSRAKAAGWRQSWRVVTAPPSPTGSAAALRDVRRTDRRDIDVTSPHGRSRKGIEVHRGRLTEADVTVHDGIPVTTIARTLVDLADVLDARALRRAVEQAERRNLLDVGDVKRALARAAGRRATKTLTAILADYEDDAILTRSELERRFLEICRRGRRPTAGRQRRRRRRRGRLQLAAPAARRRARRPRDAFHARGVRARSAPRPAPRRRRAGARFRFTYRQVVREPTGVERTLRALGSRPPPALDSIP